MPSCSSPTRSFIGTATRERLYSAILSGLRSVTGIAAGASATLTGAGSAPAGVTNAASSAPTAAQDASLRVASMAICGSLTQKDHGDETSPPFVARALRPARRLRVGCALDET